MAQSQIVPQQPEIRWQALKSVIRELYLVRDYGLQEVRTELERVHNFSASKFHYEAYLSKWGFRKNLKKDEWLTVGAIIAERRRNNLESEVCVDGVPMNTWKVKKALSRYGLSDSNSVSQVQLSQLPFGITIQTPSPEHLRHTLMNVTPTAAVSPLPVAISNHASFRPNCIATQVPTPLPTSMDPESFPTRSMFSEPFPVLLDFLPFVQFQALISIDGGDAPCESLGEPVLAGVTQSSDHQSNISSQLSAMFHGLQLEKPVPDSKALLPDNMLTKDANNLHIVSSKLPLAPASQFLNLALFMMSNRLSELDSTACQKIYRWISRRASARLFEYLLSQGGPSMEALAEQLVILSIEKRDTRMLYNITRGGRKLLNLDKLRCVDDDGEPLTLFQRACQMRDRKLIKLLLKAGVDVNYSPSSYSSPLYVLLDVMGEDCKSIPADIRLVKLLLEHGANVNPPNESPLYVAATACQVDLVALLLSKHADPNFQDDGGTPLTAALGSTAPVADIIRVTRLLIENGATVRNLVHAYDGLHSALYYAVPHGNIELIDILLEAGAPVTEETMGEATHIEDSTVIRHLVSSGAWVSEFTIETAAIKVNATIFDFLLEHASGASRSSLRSVGLIQAIHHGNHDLIDALTALHTSPVGLEVEEAMKSAAERGDIALFRMLLENDFYRTRIMSHLEGALCGSICGGHNDLTLLLLGAGVDVSSSDLCETTPLLEAVRRQNIELSYRLLAMGAAVNMKIEREMERPFCSSVLPTVVAWGYHPLIHECIELGADVNAPDAIHRKTALSISAEKGDRHSIEILINAGADVNEPYGKWERDTPLAIAISKGDMETVYQLLEMGADPNEASLIAAISRSQDLTETILKCKITKYQRYIQGFGCRGLQVAIVSSKTAIIKVLLANGVDPNFIVTAMDYRHIGQNFHPYLIDINESALGTAVRLPGKHSLVKILLDYGANPNRVVNGNGQRTALMVATDKGNLKVVKLLLLAGAKINSPLVSRGARTPLQRAVELGSMELIHTFLDHGASVNEPPCHLNGATAIQLAAIKGFVGIASLLLSKGAYIDAPAAKVGGRTAIEGASEYGRIDMIKLLIDNGAQLIGLGNAQYERARKFASDNGYAAAERLLETCRSQQLKYQEARQPDT